MAGFQVIIHGRFWVFTEGARRRPSAIGLSSAPRRFTWKISVCNYS